MRDDKGRPIGLEANELKTDIANSNYGETVLSLNKNPSDLQFNDQLSNEDILAYSNPRVITNKETFLGDALEVANNINTTTTHSEQIESEEEKFDISSLPNLNTGPTLM